MRKEKINLLDTVPFGRKDITTEWIDGLAVLVYPRFRQRWLRRLFSPYFSPYLHVALEEHGTAVWRLVDGTRTVGEIIALLAPHFGNAEDYGSRVAAFFLQLHKGGLIRLVQRGRKTV